MWTDPGSHGLSEKTSPWTGWSSSSSQGRQRFAALRDPILGPVGIGRHRDVEEGVPLVHHALVGPADEDAVAGGQDRVLLLAEGIGHEPEDLAVAHRTPEGRERGEEAARGRAFPGALAAYHGGRTGAFPRLAGRQHAEAPHDRHDSPQAEPDRGRFEQGRLAALEEDAGLAGVNRRRETTLPGGSRP